MVSRPEVPPAAQTSEGSDDIDFFAILQTLWRGRWLIASCMAAAAAAGLFYGASKPPVYQADALIQIEAKSNFLGLPGDVGQLMSDMAPSTMAEIEILKSRLIMGRASSELRLDWLTRPRLLPVLGVAWQRFRLPLPEWETLAPFSRPGEQLTLDFLQVPPDWIGEEIRVTSLGERYKVLLPDGTALVAEVGKLVEHTPSGFALKVGELAAPNGREFILVQRRDSEARRELTSSISVSEQGRQTGILRVSLTAGTPDEAVRRLNAVANAYIAQNVSKSAAEAAKSLEFVRSQIPLAERNVRDAEKALNDFRSRRRSIDLAFETQNLLSESTQVEADLRKLSLEQEELRKRFTENHPLYQQLLQNRAGLTQRLSELQSAIAALPETQREVVNLTRTLEVAQSAYLQLLGRAQELEVLQASEVGSARIIDTADALPVPVGTGLARVLSLSLILGLLSGAGIVILRDKLRKGVDSIEEIEQAGLPVFATINLIDTGKSEGKDTKIVVLRDRPDEIALEAFRSLRTSLQFGLLDAQARSIMLTSAAPTAGKTFCGVNLATVAAQAGHKVCLVDADLRRGSVHDYFRLEGRGTGLADFLADRADLQDILRPIRLEPAHVGFNVVTTGKLPPNPAELLMRKRFTELARELTALHDLVIFDVPPVLAVTDPAIVGQSVGATMLVARHAETTPGDILAVRKTLESAGVTMTGAILNGFDPKRARAGRYGYSGYGYAYSRRYAYRSHKESS